MPLGIMVKEGSTAGQVKFLASASDRVAGLLINSQARNPNVSGIAANPRHVQHGSRAARSGS
jgi:hypothetical protein